MERPPLLPRTVLTLAAAAARADTGAVTHDAEPSLRAPAASCAQSGASRSLNSSGLQTTYLLTRNFKAYKLQ
ncbi:hypothetical protein [Streptomyces violaceusniger]|uniref:Uncharacterized protein n=1 Tax=Streptomyces violaceusniger TaxID=68280 RepID=A0A4D4LHS7_STRVO|nr:hypothetical protein SVIO_094390 [Streptomyces violaceusniger]